VESKQPDLKTDRLVLRPVASIHAEAMLDYQRRNREHLEPWDPTHTDQYFTLPYWTVRLAQRAREWDEGKGAAYLLFARGDERTVIGTAALSNVARGVMQSCTLGYGIDRKLQGQGLMNEALTAMIDLAFGELGLHRIQANYQPHNQRSAAVLGRLGFVIEGRASQYLFLNGAWRDHVLTSLLNPEFDPAILP